MHIAYPERDEFLRVLKEAADRSVDFIVIVTAALTPTDTSDVKAHLAECVRVLKDGGLLFVQGRPDYLPELGVYLDQRLRFKYWIAIESTPQRRTTGLPSVHAAVLLFSKGNGRLHIRPTRFPHQHCAFCGKPLRDWGGKTHLMHPDGYAISDVWMAFPPADNYTRLSSAALDTIVRMLDFGESKAKSPASYQGALTATPPPEVIGIIGPKEGIGSDSVVREPVIRYRLPGIVQPALQGYGLTTHVEEELIDVVHCGDALDVLRRYPDNSIDLAFADPPYNLNKSYNIYEDEGDESGYVRWCNSWLLEYVRVLKPTGALYVVNLPRWAMYHASFLSRHLHFQNWIVWDALSEPRGKLMPAHYGLLFYTKHPSAFTFNYEALATLDARSYCLRPSCVRQRKARGVDEKEQLTDFWWDIHRIKHRRDRDYHPCQLPDGLMERIIRLSTNEGDTVLDALCGTGTTLVAAARLGRHYVGIDIDEEYVRISREKLAEVERWGYVKRESLHKARRAYTKKELQLELRDLAARLGRLPTPEDVRTLSRYDVRVFFDVFPSWGKALKAAKLEIHND